MPEAKMTTKTPDKSSKSKDRTISTKGLDMIIVGCIALVLLLCPVFFTGLVAQGLGFEKMILFYFLVLVGLVAWVTKGVIQGELTLKRTPLDLPIVGLIVIFVVSTILSVSTKDSTIGAYGSSSKGLIALLIFALFYFLVVNNLTAKRIKFLFWTFAFSSSLLVIYSFLQLQGVYLLRFWDFTMNKGFNPLGSLTALTMFVVSILPILVIAIAQVKEISPKASSILRISAKVFFSISLILALGILALLNGFTFWPIAIVGIVIVLMFLLAKIIKISTNNLLIPLVTFLALIILLVLGNFNIIDLALPAEVSLSRGASWDITKSALMENPIFGSGPSTFYYDFSKFKDINFNASPLWNVRFDGASGGLYEVLATTGILGGVTMAIIYLIILSISFLAIIKTEDKEVNSIMLGLFSSLVSIILFGLLFSLNNSVILMLSMITVLTVSSALIIHPEKFKSLKLSFRSSPKYALALAAIFLCVSAGVVILFTMGLKMYMADTYAKKAVMVGDQNSKISDMERAIALAPYQDTYFVTLANNYIAVANQEAIGGKNQAKIQDNLSKAIERGKSAVEIAPNKAANDEALALIYENASFYTRGALEWAENLYNKVIELEPKNPTPYLRLALVNMAKSNLESDPEEKKYFINEAIKKYNTAIEKKADLAPAYYGQAVAYEKLNNIDGAIEQLKKATLVAGRNLDYKFELGRLFFNRGVSQPNLTQTATKEITERDITSEGEKNEEGAGDELSIEPTQPTGATIQRNQDLTNAEQIFLSILAKNPNHANSLYSLAVLYKKIGETNNTRIVVNTLLKNLPEGATKEAVKKQFAGLY